jgi:hypothetical protein
VFSRPKLNTKKEKDQVTRPVSPVNGDFHDLETRFHSLKGHFHWNKSDFHSNESKFHWNKSDFHSNENDFH